MSATWFLLAAVLAAAASYGVRWRQAPDARGWHLVAFGVGAAVVLVAAQGPLYRVAETRSAVAHVAVLILLIHVAPLLMVRAITPGVLGRLAPAFASLAERTPLFVPLVLLAAVAYGWHVPAAFDAAAGNPLLAALQHASFLLVGFVVWLPVAGDPAWRRRLRGIAAFLYMTADELILGALGIVLTWAPRPLYDVYVNAPRRLWGLDADTDQTVAGAALTVVEEAPMAVALAVVFIRMLERDEAELQAEERGMEEPGAP